MKFNPNVIDWLLQSDPSVAFQTKRDLLNLPENEWQEDQQSIPTFGWGKRLLDIQDATGRWGVTSGNEKKKVLIKGDLGLYQPKYTSTHYTLLLLRRLEMPPNDKTYKGCNELSKLSYFQSIFDSSIKNQDLCIPGMVLGIFAHFRFGERYFVKILDHFAKMKVSDGGWNCRLGKRYVKEVNHFSLNTTISVLEGLGILSKNYPQYRNQVNELVASAHEVLLEHELFKSHRTGEIIKSNFIDITFPPRWRYNILSVLDYFQSIKFPYDTRMKDALDIIRNKEKKGYWFKGNQLAGQTYFNLDLPRKPSYFNTLRALRVLKTYER